ncbi:MAG: hypothetical protein ABIN89_08135 [Chitinophagaceae bacterium]
MSVALVATTLLYSVLRNGIQHPLLKEGREDAQTILAGCEKTLLFAPEKTKEFAPFYNK